MPFEAPDTPNLLPVLLQHMLNQRTQAASQEAERKERRRLEQHQLFQLAQDPDRKLDAFGALFEEIGPEDMRAALELQKSVKKQQTTQQRAAAAAQLLPASLGLTDPVLSEQGEITPNPMAAQGEAASQELLRSLVAAQPELADLFRQQIDLRKAGGESAAREAQMAQRAQQAARTEERSFARGKLVEERHHDRLLVLQQSVSSLIAESMASGQELDREALVTEVAQRAQLTPSEAELLVDRSALDAQGQGLELIRKERSAEGKSPTELDVDSIYRTIEREFYTETPPTQQEYVALLDHARAIKSGREIRDSLAESLLAEEGSGNVRPVFADVSAPGAAIKFDERRRSQRIALGTIENIEGYIGAVQDEIDAGRIDRKALALEGYTGFQKKIGTRPGLVAALDSMIFQMAVTIATSMQSARTITDFDLTNTLATLPSLQQIALNPDATLWLMSQQRSNLRMQIMADSDPKLAKQLNAVSRIKPTAKEIQIANRARLLIEKLQVQPEGGFKDRAEAEKAAKELFKLRQELPDRTPKSVQRGKFEGLYEEHPELLPGAP